MEPQEQGQHGSVISYTKRRFETPLEMLDRLREERPELKDKKLSYLGRLDPLAYGQMLVAIGEANKDREKYLGLDKTYRVKFLSGISTDTGDLLGLVDSVEEWRMPDNIEETLHSLVGVHRLPYPLYSSKTVGGKPLHEYGREGKEVERPMREMNILSLKFMGQESVSAEEVYKNAVEATEKVKGDFRQGLIGAKWKEFYTMHENVVFTGFTVELSVTSGTYIRALTELLEKNLGAPFLAYSIERTSFTFK